VSYDHYYRGDSSSCSESDVVDDLHLSNSDLDMRVASNNIPVGCNVCNPHQFVSFQTYSDSPWTNMSTMTTTKSMMNSEVKNHYVVGNDVAVALAVSVVDGDVPRPVLLVAYDVPPFPAAVAVVVDDADGDDVFVRLLLLLHFLASSKFDLDLDLYDVVASEGHRYQNQNYHGDDILVLLLFSWMFCSCFVSNSFGLVVDVADAADVGMHDVRNVVSLRGIYVTSMLFFVSRIAVFV